MKTTWVIDDSVVAVLREEARRRQTTMAELVEQALRAFLRPSSSKRRLAPLPRFHGGGILVDVADRDALYATMEEL